MLSKNKAKERLQRGEIVLGCMALIPDPAIAEILGMAGFDYLMMDAEHGAYDARLMENMVRACEVVGVTPMARLPLNDPQALEPFLDTGLMGVTVPHCRTAADVARLVDGSKYPPIGRRGVGPGRVGRYGSVPTGDLVRHLNEQMMVLPLVEDVDGIRNLPEMLTIPGVDGYLLGPNDLASSMGYPGNMGHPDVQEAIANAIRLVRDAGLCINMTPKTTDPDDARRYIDMGANIIIFGEVPLLRQASAAAVKEFRAAFGGA